MNEIRGLAECVNQDLMTINAARAFAGTGRIKGGDVTLSEYAAGKRYDDPRFVPKPTPEPKKRTRRWWRRG